MGVGSGAGNAISFSEIQAFYGGSNPISISEYARGGDNVPSSFAGSSTATTGTSSQTVDDFAVTVTERDGDLVQLTTSGSNQANAPFPINASSGSLTLLNTTSFVSVTIVGQGTCNFFINGSNIGSVNVDNDARGFIIKGPQFNTGDRTSTSVNTVFSAGDVFTLSCGTSGGQNARTNTSTHGVRAVEFDITFQNNNSTGDTYTLTSSSTGHSSKSVYAAGDSFLAQDNGSNNQFILAYDNVTGAGPGTAGDINVTETSAFTGVLQNQTASASVSIQSDTAKVEIFNVHPDADGGSSTVNTTVSRNGSSIGTFTTTDNNGNGATILACTIAGPANNGAVSSPNGGTHSSGTITFSGGSSSMREVTRAAQFTTVFTNSSGSESYTLGGSSTGGAATLAAGATRNVQTTNSSGSSWAVHFDTGSGDCNTNIPTAISSGNPVNLDLFNAPGTPVG